MSKLFHSSQTYRNCLVQLLAKFTNSFNKDVISQIYHLIKQKSSDEIIINYIAQHRVPLNLMKSTSRAVKLSNIWLSLIKPVLAESNTIIETYLDVGSNDGLITVELGKNLNLGSENIYGVDIDKFTEQDIVPVNNFTYKNYNGYNLPFTDNYFNLITCSMVLHHVKYPNILISDIRRILKDNCFLFVKEHDAFSEEVKWLVYLEHMFYDVMDYGITYNDFVKTYYQKLFSKKELLDVMENFGFVLVKSADEQFMKRYHKVNPTQTYYAIFKKIVIN